MTHAHLDHTFATAFTEPYYDARNEITLWAPQSVLDSLKNLLGPNSSLREVYFPTNFDQMKGIKRFVPIELGTPIEIDGTRIDTYPLNHPGGCVAFRFDRGPRRLVFASDHEHHAIPDLQLANFARDADLFYADAQYLRDEYDGKTGISGDWPQSRQGWGHSTVEAAIETAIAAGAKRLHLGHHDPKRNDDQLAEILTIARRLMRSSLDRLDRPPNSCQVELAGEGDVYRV